MFQKKRRNKAQKGEIRHGMTLYEISHGKVIPIFICNRGEIGGADEVAFEDPPGKYLAIDMAKEYLKNNFVYTNKAQANRAIQLGEYK